MNAKALIPFGLAAVVPVSPLPTGGSVPQFSDESFLRTGNSDVCEFRVDEIDDERPTVAVALPTDDWNEEAEARFVELAALEALGELDGSDAKELEQLEKQRREAQPSLTFEEMKRNRNVHIATMRMIAAIDEWRTLIES